MLDDGRSGVNDGPRVKLYVASIICEVNSFSPVPTGWAAFESEGIRRPGQPANPAGIEAALEAVADVARAAGWRVHEGLCAAAQPLGPVVQSAYERLRDELLAGLDDAGDVDGVVLLLHGAMIADACDDCEGELLDAVRARVGPAVPIGVELDLHCHLTTRMATATPLLVPYQEYPHTDIAARAALVTRLVIDTARGRIRPTLAVHDCRMVGFWPTDRQPMRDIVARLQALERDGTALAAAVVHGFAYGDVPEAGAKTCVVTDGDAGRARALAEELAQELWSRRDALRPRVLSVPDALERLTSGGLRTVLADMADNPGGGARGDSTFLLEALYGRGIDAVALGGLWDPGAVQLCRDAGAGARLQLRVGGKSGPSSGWPLDLPVTVRAVRDDHWQYDFGQRSSLGPSAWVSTDRGQELVLISRCQQTLSRELFEGLGLRLADCRAVVVKSTQHFVADFGAHFAEILYVATPGLLRPDVENLPYRRRDPNFWPRVADPFAAGTQPAAASQASASATQAAAPIGINASLKS